MANVCPYCGGDPQALTQNDANGKGIYECENGHTWNDPAEP